MTRTLLKIRHRLFVPIASYLPDSALLWLLHKWPKNDEDGWNFWLEAHFESYCRKQPSAYEGDEDFYELAP